MPKTRTTHTRINITLPIPLVAELRSNDEKISRQIANALLEQKRRELMKRNFVRY